MSEVWGLVTYTQLHPETLKRALSPPASLRRFSFLCVLHLPYTPAEKATNWHIGCPCGCGGNVSVPRQSKGTHRHLRSNMGTLGRKRGDKEHLTAQFSQRLLCHMKQKRKKKDSVQPVLVMLGCWNCFVLFSFFFFCQYDLEPGEMFLLDGR